MTHEEILSGEDSETTAMPGVVAALGDLGSGAVITEQALAGMFGRCPTTVKRAVDRGELPPPCRMFGQNAWTVGVLVGHIENRLAQAAAEAEEMAKKIRQLSP